MRTESWAMPEVVNRETEDRNPLPRISGRASSRPHAYATMAVPLVPGFLRFLEIAKLGCPGPRQKPANGIVGTLVVGGVIPIQSF